MKKISAKEIIRACGGPVAVSNKIASPKRKGNDRETISSQAISQWKFIPPQYCILLESLCDYTRYQMRPDVFGSGKTKKRAS